MSLIWGLSVGDLIKLNDHKSSRSISLVVFTPKTDYPCDLQNPSKLTDEQMDKVRRIVHRKLNIKTFSLSIYYPSGANYPTDKPSQTDNLSLV